MDRSELRAGPDIVLRPLRLADVPELFRLTDGSRDRLRTWLPWVDLTDGERATASFVRAAAAQHRAGGGFHAAIRVGGTLAGVVGLHGHQRPHGQVSLGYWLGDGFEGRGIMTASAGAMIGYAFAVLAAHRVEIRAATGNRRSRAVAERLGFRLEGMLRGAERLAAGWADHAVYGLLAEDWARMRGGTRSPAGPRPAEAADRDPTPGAADGGSHPQALAHPPDDAAVDADMSAYYTARAPEYDDWYERRGRYADAATDATWLRELAQLEGRVASFRASLPPSAAVCDVGCGTGRWTARLAERRDLRVAGVDRAAATLAEADSRLRDLGLSALLVRGDALDLPFADGAFDALTSLFLFDHLSEAQRPEFFANLRRVARPGARLLVADSRREPRHTSDLEIQMRPLRSGRRYMVRKHLFTAATLAEALAPLGAAAAGETPTHFVWAEIRL